jgi:AraC family transcriptional regulator
MDTFEDDDRKVATAMSGRRAIPTLIASLIEGAVARLEVDRNESHAYLMRALALLSSHDRNPGSTQSAPILGRLARWKVNRVIGYIDINLASEIRSGDLARLVDLSESHFSRAFKSSVGVSPLDYITRRRVELAREMMRASDQALAQIAVVCGWSDQSHFCRVFRRVVGLSPDAWRRANAIDPKRLRGVSAGATALELRGTAPQMQAAQRPLEARAPSVTLPASRQDLTLQPVADLEKTQRLGLNRGTQPVFPEQRRIRRICL